MTRITSILAAAVFAAFSMSALAADDAKAAKKQASETYKMDKKNCDGMKGKEKSACRKEAKAKYDQALAQVKSEKKADKQAKKSGGSSGSSAAPSSSTPPSTPPAPTTK
jgi:hypothetical protein